MTVYAVTQVSWYKIETPIIVRIFSTLQKANEVCRECNADNRGYYYDVEAWEVE